ncbi:hypothetical protein SAY86_009309 [Trapa natans]|uniref:Uncharacterized protein n=1 Tax=Trapa natans TaxID=22666 RepID=A0AAN7KZI4_TRANT|nr:hypothetical protein SAY86_009309 [Trapa natans]
MVYIYIYIIFHLQLKRYRTRNKVCAYTQHKHLSIHPSVHPSSCWMMIHRKRKNKFIAGFCILYGSFTAASSIRSVVLEKELISSRTNKYAFHLKNKLTTVIFSSLTSVTFL